MDDLFSASFSIDTRTLKQGDVFIALTTGQRDGHDFAKNALELGASRVIVSRDLGLKDRQILCDDTLDFISNLATRKCNIMRANGTKIIGITGSVGKTSTKEITGLILKKYKTYQTQGNYNNHIGLPLTILNSPVDLDFLILEMGMNALGEIDKLSQIARPDVSVITNIGEAHIGKLGTLENISRAKAEIINHSPKNSILILDKNSIYTSQVSQKASELGIFVRYIDSNDIQNYQVNGNLTSFSIDKNSIILPFIASKQWLSCVLFAYEICKIYKLDYNLDFGNIKLVGRGNEINININNKKITIINDSYNASPRSVQNALEILGQRRGKKLAILGEMRELGDFSESLHENLVNFIPHDTDLICISGYMRCLCDKFTGNKKFYLNVDELIDNMPNIEAYDLILTKGSHGVNLQKFIDHITINRG